jgi:hypothetical protein
VSFATKTIYDETGLGGADSGNWHVMGERSGQLRVFTAEVAGTVVAELQGRISPDSVAVVVENITATAGALVTVFPEMRVVVTSATAGSLRVDLDCAARDTGA